MIDETREVAHRWWITGKSVRGAAHRRRDIPNQDALNWTPLEDRRPPVLVALADGHGGEKSFRSDVGARIAVNVALDALGELVEARRRNDDEDNLTFVNRFCHEYIPRKIWTYWRRAVDEELERTPFEKSELALVFPDNPPENPIRDERRFRPFGSTLVAALFTDEFFFFLQLGDGDAIVVDDRAVATRVFDDPPTLGEETHSLCGEEAWKRTKCRFQKISDQPPVLTLLATDGYSKSFVNDEAFLQVGTDLLKIVRKQGVDYVDHNLETWLSEASSDGSGDDATAALIYHLEDDEGSPIPSLPPIG